MRILGIMLLLLVALQGCGRKAPLFMPPPVNNAHTAPDQSEQKKQP
jgi:predicted small lipoprotein YifL